jgi:hypothetical protein
MTGLGLRGSCRRTARLVLAADRPPSLRRRPALLLPVLALLLAPAALQTASPQAPARLPDREFWRIVETFSEASGYFNSDNLVSNEDTFQRVIPELVQTVKPGGIYVGVGPDQNFTYIAAVGPAMAFIADVRRGNLLLHLMYKALFELAADRADFLSRLFSRPRPPGLGRASTLPELFDAYRGVKPNETMFDANLGAMLAHLTKTHGFVLVDGDARGIEFVYSNFYAGGPELTFVAGGAGRRNSYPSYASVQLSTDADGRMWGYLSSEASFARIKSYQERNLIVPIVGNFAGPRALASIANDARERRATVTTFYTSNVEQYLFQDGLWEAFRRNVARMPLDETSTFVRSCFTACSQPAGSRSATLLDSMLGLLADAEAGRVRGYWDVLSHARSAR